MKKSARNRIIIWSIVSVLLTVILVFSIIKINTSSFVLANLFRPTNWQGLFIDEDELIEGGGTIDADAVNAIDINWASGNVEVEYSNTDEITIAEEGYSSNNKLCWYIDDDKTLYIYPHLMSSTSFILLGSNGSKNLTVTLPENKSLLEFEVNTASASFTAEAINATEADINTASGSISIDSFNGNDIAVTNTSGTVDLNNIKASKVEAESISGEVNVTGDYLEFDGESVSGEINAQIKNNRTKFDASTVSGSVNLDIIESISGFEARLDSVSGKLSCEFKGTSSNDKFAYGDRSSSLNVETVSGDLKIKSYKE